ncbi:gluconeogenesis factor YvcK family protein [Oceanobacillus jeddahense]|uniref:Gluconeogenesis factor n=1 Tax=Oceanobacillus jeddahense TaxID=1462527 RepID=A0ABY5JP47_9BACI|nr:YvcK family protein [Oceanobacillus jeddahense]UUI02075.1 YvcK family protein [Oceanobacillus jeddahense]
MSHVPKITAIGGGTGMPVLLRGLKDLPIELTAVVTVADDGGSTGRIRTEMEMPAPGDIRNVIAALSDAEPMLLELFQHRFQQGNGLIGHSLGNLLLAAMTSMTGNFNQGIKEISRVLNVKGNIYPISNDNMSLHAIMEDGEIIHGESNIPLSGKRIKRIFLEPQPLQPLPNAVESIHQADLIVISPGSLYTSIMPNLIVPEVKEALLNTKAKIVYVCNIMTQYGETTNYSAADHVQAIHDHVGDDCIDYVIVHNQPIDEQTQEIYKEEKAFPVEVDMDRLKAMKVQVIPGNIVVKHKDGTLRHNNGKIAEMLYQFL